MELIEYKISKALYWGLKRIELDKDNHHKDDSYYQVFEATRKENKLLEEVVQGTTSFSKSLAEITSSIKGVNTLIPSTFKEKYEGQMKDLSNALGYWADNGETLAINPVGGVVFAGVICMPTANYLEPKMSRRRFLTFLGASAAVGIGTTLPFSGLRQSEVQKAELRAEYCDNLVQRLYHL